MNSNRLPIVVFLCAFGAGAYGTAQTSQDLSASQGFPLQITIESSIESGLSANISPERQAQAATMGMELPDFVVFHGKINGEDHWTFGCRKENALRESIPCTSLPAGEFRGRWIHDHSLLQIVGGTPDTPLMRFLMVSDNPSSPPSDDNLLMHSAVFDFPVQFPNDKSPKDYPLLVHVYGGYSVDVPVGNLPTHRRCSLQAWSTYQTNVRCTDYPPIEIHRGIVGLDISTGYVEFASLQCDAKWRSHCSLLDPGLYYARTEKSKLMLLTHDQSEKPQEIAFSVNLPKKSTQSPIK